MISGIVRFRCPSNATGTVFLYPNSASLCVTLFSRRLPHLEATMTASSSRQTFFQSSNSKRKREKSPVPTDTAGALGLILVVPAVVTHLPWTSHCGQGQVLGCLEDAVESVLSSPHRLRVKTGWLLTGILTKQDHDPYHPSNILPEIQLSTYLTRLVFIDYPSWINVFIPKLHNCVMVDRDSQAYTSLMVWLGWVVYVRFLE